MVNQGEKLLYSARETAAMLGLSQKTVWSISTPRGTLPVVRVGSRTLYSKTDLEAWIESQRQPA
jgi:excisionase family DNA binding protein